MSVKGDPANFVRFQVRVVTDSGDAYVTEPRISRDGRYRTESLPPGDLTLHIMAAIPDSRLRRQSVALSLPADQVLRHDVDFAGRAAIRGDLLGLDAGQHARVFALIDEPERQPRNLEQLNELTHAAVGRRFMRGNGGFRFESLEPGEYTLYAIALRDESPEDFAQAPTATITVDTQQTTPATLTF